jgi:hypothetical protein
MSSIQPRHRAGAPIACCSTSSSSAQAQRADSGLLARQHFTSMFTPSHLMDDSAPSSPSNRHASSWRARMFTASAYIPRCQTCRFQAPNTSGTPTAYRWAHAKSSGVLRQSLSALHKAARQALPATSPEISSGRSEEAPNHAMQQTVMSPPLWFCMDHLPGSCLLLILRRYPAN